MDGEEGTDAGEGRVARKRGPEVDRDEAGLPVVAVENVGGKEVARHAQGGAGEDSEANVIVRVVDAGGPVVAGAVEERRAVDEIEGELGGGLIDGGVVAGGTEMDGEVVVDAAGAGQVECAVAGDDNGGLVAVVAEGGGEGADDVCQPAGFRQG